MEEIFSWMAMKFKEMKFCEIYGWHFFVNCFSVCFIKEDLKKTTVIGNDLHIRELTELWNMSVSHNPKRNKKLNMREQLQKEECFFFSK